jgi:Holliday junction resolvase RusA-like endonuclease
MSAVGGRNIIEVTRMYLTIPVIPTGQQRPRFTAQGKFGRAYKSKTQKAHEKELGYYIQQQKPDEPLQGPLEVMIDAFFPVPKSWPKWKTEAALAGEIRPDKKPDIDNVIKGLLDCSNGILFEDDRQIVSVMGRKFYAAEPRLEYGIREVG